MYLEYIINRTHQLFNESKHRIFLYNSNEKKYHLKFKHNWEVSSSNLDKDVQHKPHKWMRRHTLKTISLLVL